MAQIAVEVEVAVQQIQVAVCEEALGVRLTGLKRAAQAQAEQSRGEKSRSHIHIALVVLR
ncbi:hypothetical protein ACE0DR_07130 [Azotobacter sp. CWF10]